MFNLLGKKPLSVLLALLSFSTILGAECCDPSACNRTYVGAFGGGIYSNSNRLSQIGTVFFTEAQGGPLAVYAGGRSKDTSSGFGGVQLGYEWSQCPVRIGCSEWTLAPAVEMEAYWYSHNKKGQLTNPTDRIPEHNFSDSLPMNMGVYLANVAFSFNNPCLGKFSPYVGGGIGVAHISIKHADSIQIDPPELGINHFNSRPDDSSWAFAAQLKAGLRYNICGSFHIFGEYRYLFVDSSNYIFGSTVFPGHAPTSPWNVKVNNINYNAFTMGIQYDL